MIGTILLATVSGGIQTLAAFGLYFLVIIGIGVYASRFSSRGISEYFVGGRKMHRFVVALSAVVSGRSAWLLLGFTGMAYKMGISAVWAAVGYVSIEFFLFLYYAPRIREFSENHDCITLPDFYAARFKDKSGSLRILLVVIFLIFMVSYVSAQFVGGGKAFATSFGIPRNTGLLITAGIILIYTFFGGFLAVSLTDVLQAIFMIVALVVLPFIGIMEMGGWEAVAGEVTNFDALYLDPFALAAGTLIGFLGIGLGSPGNPHILIRYMSIEDPGQFKWTAVVGTIWNILMAGGALFVGLVGRAYFPESGQLLNSDPENLYPEFARIMLHPVFYGILLASVFAAIMSTADSQLLVAASAVVRDIYEKVIHRGQKIPQKRLVVISRAVVSILVAIAVVLGLLAEDLVFWLVLFAWAGLGAAIGPTSLLALFWKKTTREGVVAGLITGTVIVIAWKLIPVLEENLYELIPAFFGGLIVTVVVSLFTQNRGKA